MSPTVPTPGPIKATLKRIRHALNLDTHREVEPERQRAKQWEGQRQILAEASAARVEQWEEQRRIAKLVEPSAAREEIPF